MARNQEKAQSMLYRFREAQAQSLGLAPKTARRPRLASSVTSLKECERWRGDVIRDISRKVSKIQDFGLTDYEVRDLNDEINKLLREKVHWENQILVLGGANYTRSVPSMLGGDQGASAGRGGYKYFGRAKDLPGVKELFSGRKDDEADGWRSEKYQRFKDLPPSYYGDEDENDGVLLAEEARAEEVEWNQRFLQVVQGLQHDLRHRDAAEEDMDLSDTETSNGGIEVPLIPRPAPQPWKQSMHAFAHAFNTAYTHPDPAPDASEAETPSKRAPDSDDDAHADAKRQKGEHGQPVAATQAATSPTEGDAAAAVSAPSAGYSIFSADDLQHPEVPDRAAIEKVILQAKKRQLRQEYIGA
ncbi:related to pre-mRNA splicing factor [Sporisorium reilianum f. sp. reilianum]|uniref:Related to pre-mRNA splicing factor n=1 Tax=Sporisorium reilianum f. sp. reilianum TaxID=72559 RepID=A0A2N8U9K8_9BASI|nr:related to pre-mRNA splicing factor [Sporisorium reilianum f. sp. reilianum]